MAAFSDFLRNRIERNQRDRGAILVLTALVMLLLLFVAAFATDLGAWYRQGQAQQRAADVGSLNGIQAYNRGVQAFFDGESQINGLPVTWLNASPGQKQAAERAGMTEAVNTVVGLLETSGLTFNNNPDPEIVSEPTPDQLPEGESVYRIVADDGTVVIISRVRVTDPVDGTTSNAITVSLTADGQQYFSNLLRDAPEITRVATSTSSNCGGICNSPFEIFPPFSGFAAAGSGDGYSPLLFNRDNNAFNGPEEVWAINHHVSHHPERRSAGDIICMDTDTQAPCAGFNFDLKTEYQNLQTGNRPIEYIDGERGLILFAARDAGIDMTGLACFDARERDFCDTPFHEMFQAVNGPNRGWGGFINAHGPFRRPGTNEFYVFAQDGTWACAQLNADTTMSDCANPSGDTPARLLGGMPSIEDGNWYIAHGEQVEVNGTPIDNRLYMRQVAADRDVRFYCFDLSTQANCSGWTGSTDIGGFGYHSDNDLTFLRRNATGVPTDVCVVNLNNTNSRHVCASTANGNVSINPIGNDFNDMAESIAANWGGDTFTWQSLDGSRSRTFFGGGASNRIGCWDWKDSDNCGGSIAASTLTFSGDNVAPYAFAQVSSDCIIGLTHRPAQFFDFNPADLTSCLASSSETTIQPCTCEDGTLRWGLVRVPDELLNVIETGTATLTDPATDMVWVFQEPIAGPGATGELDLSHVPSDVAELEVLLEVEASVNPDGSLKWDGPIIANLELVVQPTLTN